MILSYTYVCDNEIKQFMNTSGGESVEPVGEVHPDVGGPHHHLHHRQPLPPLLANRMFQIFGQTQMYLTVIGQSPEQFLG